MALRIHLADWAFKKRKSVRDISRETGIRSSTISNLKNEKSRRIQLDDIEKICRCLDITPGDLFEVIDDESDENKEKKPE